eukprot:Lankesteria_metandrocarpae@DN2668_c0_g1_i2.p1
MFTRIACSLVAAHATSALRLAYSPLNTAVTPHAVANSVANYASNASKPLFMDLNFPKYAAPSNILAAPQAGLTNFSSGALYNTYNQAVALQQQQPGQGALLGIGISPPLVSNSAATAVSPLLQQQALGAFPGLYNVPTPPTANTPLATAAVPSSPLLPNGPSPSAAGSPWPSGNKSGTFTPDEEGKIKKLVQDIQDLVAQAASKEGMTITLETHLEHDLEMDSLAKMDLLLEIEKKHDVTLSEDESGSIETVGHIVDHVNSKLTR